MAEPTSASANHYEVDLEPGVEYLWCACGRPANRPFGDYSHEGREYLPKPTQLGEAMRLYFCGCDHTSDAHYCDGSHAGL